MTRISFLILFWFIQCFIGLQLLIRFKKPFLKIIFINVFGFWTAFKMLFVAIKRTKNYCFYYIYIIYKVFPIFPIEINLKLFLRQWLRSYPLFFFPKLNGLDLEHLVILFWISFGILCSSKSGLLENILQKKMYRNDNP